MFDCFVGGKFSGKCRSAVKRIKSRIEAIGKKKQAVLRLLKNDVADLLAAGRDSDAFGRIDALISEINQISCYEMIEQFCDLILNQLPSLRKKRECPDGVSEAVSTLIFAAARFPDLPELCDLRHVFTKRYGGQTESFVNAEFMEKVQKKEFSKEKKLQLLQNIVEEFSIRWDSWAFEQKSSNSPAAKYEQPKRAVLPHSANDATPPMLTKISKEETLSKKNHEPTPITVARTQVQEPKNNYMISTFSTDQLHGTVVKTRKVNANEIENVEPYQINAVVPPYGNVKIKQKGSCGNDDLRYVPRQRTTKVQEQLDPRGPEKQVGIMNSWNDKPNVVPPYTKSNGNSNKSQVIEKSANGLEYDRSQRHEEWSDPNAKERLPIRSVNNKGTAINMIPPYVKPKVNDISVNGDRMIQRLGSAGHNKPCHTNDNYKDQVPSDERIMSNSLQRNSQKPAVMETNEKSIYDEKLTSQTPRSQRRHRSRRSAGANGDYFDEGKNITRQPRAPIDDELDNAIVYGKLMSQTSPWHGRNGGKLNVTTYDEEYEKEMVMDRLLIHYSKKGTTNERIKTRRRTRISSMDHVLDSDRSMDNQCSGRFQPGPGVSAAHPPERAVSLPPEPVRSAEALKLPTRAILMQSDLLSPSGRRVHSRLPEYDELASRFAALKKD
ncbi:hypothetical protein C4D60_Mb05t25410 [Musa balbisiana]|uniref:IST1-like protein n=1 Tax=Musa balbisiana TaxID=52838 RepID=A0A4S8JYU7_MUSBA|nr:hypothetical protein C4D60_Mb05t25410 [Musa balbisiana]